MTVDSVIKYIRKQLQDNIDEKTLTTSQHFFKEKITYYGVKVPTINNLSKEIFKLTSSFTKQEIFEVCDGLWESGILEESLFACNWSYYLHKHYKPQDFQWFEKWIKTNVNNWASCDTLCNHSVGEFVVMFPEFIHHLKQFALSDNRWVKRAGAVTLIIPARKGKFLENIFEIADMLLLDTDDMVQKGYGWMLKAASQADQDKVFEYVMKNRNIMPRTALRYAIEKMPSSLKLEAMKKE